MTTTPYPALTQAFELLQQTVQDLHHSGRRRVGAFLKPELVRRSGGTFSEVALGFAKFHEFLRAAQAAQVVALTPSGPDLEAWPVASYNPPPRRQQPEEGLSAGLFTPQPTRISIRPDLWLTFVDFTPGFLRLYDKLADRAYKIPQAIYPGESAQATALRQRFQVRDPNLLLLEPISQAAVLDWMRGFAAEQAGPLGDQLRVAVNSDHPMQAFTQVVRSRPELYGHWHRQRVEKVAEHIRSLFARYGIQTQVTVPYDPVARASGVPSGIRRSECAPGAAIPTLSRGRLPDSGSAIRQIDDIIRSLLKLRGTIGFLESPQADE